MPKNKRSIRAVLLNLVALTFSSLCMSSVSFAQEFLLCRARNAPTEVTITLSAFRKFGHAFNCVNGAFVVDLSGCAPNGAYGLHLPTGSAALVSVVTRWQDYYDHRGGITGNFVSSTEIYFSGGFNSPESGYEEEWSFTISRLTGAARLKQKDSILEYDCEKRVRKF